MPCDYRDEPKDWPEIRERIMERAESKCEFCGVPNYCVGYRRKRDGNFIPCADDIEHACRDTYLEARELLISLEENEPLGLHDERGIVTVLTVAHLDHDITNSDPDNLKALCQQCHLRYDAKHHQSNAARTRGNRRLASQPVLFDTEDQR